MASYASSWGLKIHMGYCKINKATIDTITDNPSDSMSRKRPLLSIATDVRLSSQNSYNHDYYSCNACDGDDGFDSTLDSKTSDGNSEKSTSTSSTLTGAKKIQTMAVTKLQVNLNNLINRNNASLGMYDDICQLFNDYISSRGFDAYAKLKKRQTFLAAYWNQVSYFTDSVVCGLIWYIQVCLIHSGHLPQNVNLECVKAQHPLMPFI